MNRRVILTPTVFQSERDFQIFRVRKFPVNDPVKIKEIAGPGAIRHKTVNPAQLSFSFRPLLIVNEIMRRTFLNSIPCAEHEKACKG